MVLDWSTEQIRRWYFRGRYKMHKALRIEVLLSKLINLDLYVKLLMKLNITAMEKIQTHHHKTITIDTESSGFRTSEDDRNNAGDDCEHEECHDVKCKVQMRTAKRIAGDYKDVMNICKDLARNS